MKQLTQRDSGVNGSLPKAATGIQGLDEVTGGGFPRGRPTLICGSAGAGKTSKLIPDAKPALSEVCGFQHESSLKAADIVLV